jgi:hypothetical protein
VSSATHSSLIGATFAITAAVLFCASLSFLLSRRRSAYVVLLSLFALILVIGPFALTQLSRVQSHFGIVVPQERDTGFDIYIAVLLLLAVFAIWQVNRYNKRNRAATPTI